MPGEGREKTMWKKSLSGNPVTVATETLGGMNQCHHPGTVAIGTSGAMSLQGISDETGTIAWALVAGTGMTALEEIGMIALGEIERIAMEETVRIVIGTVVLVAGMNVATLEPEMTGIGMVTGAEDLQDLTETLVDVVIVIVTLVEEGTETLAEETETVIVTLVEEGTETVTLAEETVTGTLAEETETGTLVEETGIETLVGGVTWDEMTVTATVALEVAVWTWMIAVVQHVLMKAAPGGLLGHHQQEKGLVQMIGRGALLPRMSVVMTGHAKMPGVPGRNPGKRILQRKGLGILGR